MYAQFGCGIACRRFQRPAIESGNGERHSADLLRDVLALPPEARAALIDPLIESLDQTIDEGAEEAWRREIEARLEQIDTGAVKLI